MPRNAGYPLHIEHPLDGHPLPLGNRLGADAAQRPREGDRAARLRLRFFTRGLHARIESTSFKMPQALLSMKARLSRGIVAAMDTNTATGKRIKYLRTVVLDLSQESFAEQLDNVTRGAVGNWERGKGIKRENLERMARAFHVSFEWLALGRGKKPAPRNWDPASPDFEEIEVPITMPVEAGRRVQGLPEGAIPEIDVIAGLGGGGLTTTAQTSMNGITFSADVIRDHWRLPDWILSRWHVRPHHVAVLQSQGDSMSPTIGDGDPIFVDTRHRVPSPPGIYALADEFGGVVVKRLEVVSRPGEDPVRVLVSSDNKHHQSRELTLDEIAIIGRYLGRLTN